MTRGPKDSKDTKPTARRKASVVADGADAATAPQSAGPVAEWGRQLVRAWAALDANNDQRRKCDDDGAEQRHVEREEQVLIARKEAIQGMVAFTQATSLEGALCQVALAHGLADSIGACGDAECHTCKSDLKHISAALHSAANIIDRIMNGGVTDISR